MVIGASEGGCEEVEKRLTSLEGKVRDLKERKVNSDTLHIDTTVNRARVCHHGLDQGGMTGTTRGAHCLQAALELRAALMSRARAQREAGRLAVHAQELAELCAQGRALEETIGRWEARQASQVAMAMPVVGRAAPPLAEWAAYGPNVGALAAQMHEVRTALGARRAGAV